MQNASQRDSVSPLRGISGIAAFSIAGSCKSGTAAGDAMVMERAAADRRI